MLTFYSFHKYFFEFVSLIWTDVILTTECHICNSLVNGSQCPRGLSSGSAATRQLKFGVRIPLVHCNVECGKGTTMWEWAPERLSWILVTDPRRIHTEWHQQFNIQQLYALPTLYLCVLCLSENRQRLVPLTA